MIEYFNRQNHDVVEIIKSLFDMVFVKTLIGAATVIISFGFDALQAKALIALFILILADALSAVFVAYKKGDQISSAKFFRTPIKIGIYFGLIYLAHITEYAFPPLLGVLDETMIAFCVTTELISIMENVNMLGYPVPTKLLSKLINVRDNQ